MRGKGINYDTGFITANTTTHEPFEPEVVKREMRIIRNDLHCTAVRITGGLPDRLEIAAAAAAEADLEVWFCPFTNGLDQEQLLELLADCAARAERLRRSGTEVVFLTGAELSLLTTGFLPGETLEERLALLADPPRLRAAVALVPAKINDFLSRAVALVRTRFAGRISYASLPLERVDWSPFDLIATDAGYRSAALAESFRDNIRTFVAQGKPAAITEFGCATFRGAAALGGKDDTILEWGRCGEPRRLNQPLRLKRDLIREEEEQATYLREVLEVLDEEGVDSAFVYTFARYDLPHREDPKEDFDLASLGIVKVLEHGRGTTYPDLRWEPKVAFKALAELYAKL
jgi:hypothetical protein